jgi:hypothetical protein
MPSAAAAVLAAVLTVMACGAGPALAYGDHPWCAVTSGGLDVHWECEFDSIEACRPNVIAGNRGFCNPNPNYQAAPKRRAAPRKHRRHRS